MKRMNKRGIVIGVAAMMGLGLMATAFVANSSPYITIPQALSQGGSNVHVAGQLVSGSVRTSAELKQVSFGLTDESGKNLEVVYKGVPPGNLTTATKIVAIGTITDGKLLAHDLLLKCPTKYEAGK